MNMVFGGVNLLGIVAAKREPVDIWDQLRGIVGRIAGPLSKVVYLDPDEIIGLEITLYRYDFRLRSRRGLGVRSRRSRFVPGRCQKHYRQKDSHYHQPGCFHWSSPLLECEENCTRDYKRTREMRTVFFDTELLVPHRTFFPSLAPIRFGQVTCHRR